MIAVEWFSCILNDKIRFCTCTVPPILLPIVNHLGNLRFQSYSAVGHVQFQSVFWALYVLQSTETIDQQLIGVPIFYRIWSNQFYLAIRTAFHLWLYEASSMRGSTLPFYGLRLFHWQLHPWKICPIDLFTISIRVTGKLDVKVYSTKPVSSRASNLWPNLMRLINISTKITAQ